MVSKLNISGSSNLEVVEGFLGGNFLYHMDSLKDTHLDLLNDLNVTHLRYPGGSITESTFDVTNWDADRTPASYSGYNRSLVPLTEYLQFVSDNDFSTSIVLPTMNLFLGDPDPSKNDPRGLDFDQIQATLDFVRMILSSDDDRVPAARITALELGNEYWGHKITSAEYGKLVDYLAPEIKKIIDELDDSGLLNGGEAPKIISQMAAPWAHEFHDGGYNENSPSGGGWSWTAKMKAAHDDMADQIGMEARKAIDGLVEHYYYKGSDSRDSTFNGGSKEKRSLETVIDFWKNEPGMQDDFEVHITEWNVRTQQEDSLGLVAVSTTLQQIEYMLRMGVDAAQVWPLQGALTTNLAGDMNSPEMTIQGTGFKMFSDVLTGTELLEDNFFGEKFEVSAFEGKDSTHIFISLRSYQADSFDLDISDLLGSGDHVKAILLGADEGSSDGQHKLGNGINETSYFNEWDVRPVVSNLSSDDLFSKKGVVSWHFEPFEVLRIDISNGSYGMTIDGQVFNPDGNYLSYISETMTGARGDDVIRGGVGNDRIYGEAGDDLLEGDEGADVIYGGTGNDLIRGDNGNDEIYGGAGSDRIMGGAGHDTIFGGSGADVIEGKRGNDVLEGGSGADTFVFSRSGGDDEIIDFEVGLDVLKLESDLWSGDLTAVEVIDEYFTPSQGGGRFEFDDGTTIQLSNLDFIIGLEDSLIIV